MFNKILNTFFTKSVGAILTFIIALVLSHAVGPTGKGEQSLFLTTLTFILLASDIVSGNSLIYLAPKHPFAKLVLPAYLWSALIGLLAILVIPACIAGSAWLYSHFATLPAPTTTLSFTTPFLIRHLGLLAIVVSINSVNISMLIGRERVKAANYLNLWQPCGLLLTWLLCFFGLSFSNLSAYITALYVAYGGSWIAGLFLLRHEFRTFTFHSLRAYGSVLKDLFKYGILNELSAIVQKINMRVTYLLFPLFFSTAVSVDALGKTHSLGEAYTGIFSNAVAMAEAIWIISRSISLVQYARIANSSDRTYAQRLTLDLAKICFAISALGMVVLALFPAAFYVKFFGTGFGEVATLVRILIPGSLMMGIYLILDHYYSGIGKYHINIYAALCGLLFTVVCGLLLIPRYHIYGAAITTSISYIVTALFLMFMFLKDSDFRFKDYLITRPDMQHYAGMWRTYWQENFKK